jgi:hypothetical protein
LPEDGGDPGLTDHQIRPLDDHDGHEEGRVARVLQDLAVPVGPLLGSILRISFGLYLR